MSRGPNNNPMNYTTVCITPHTYTFLKMALHVNEWMNHVTPCYVWINYTIHIHYMNESHHTHTWMNELHHTHTWIIELHEWITAYTYMNALHHTHTVLRKSCHNKVLCVPLRSSVIYKEVESCWRKFLRACQIFIHLHWVQRVLHTCALCSWASAFLVSSLHVSWVRDVSHDYWHAFYFLAIWVVCTALTGLGFLMFVTNEVDLIIFFPGVCVFVCVCVHTG